MDEPRGILFLLVLLFAFALTGAQVPCARADEEPEEDVEIGLLACGEHLLVEIPLAWRTHEDPRGRWAEAHDPADTALRVRLSRHSLADEETREGWRSRHLASERSAAFEGPGSWFEERRDAGTLVVRPLADPPVLSLYAHEIRGGEGQVFQADIPLYALPEQYEACRSMCERFRDLAPPKRPDAKGWPRRFTHEIPEEVSFRDHPFLQVVEAATAKGIFPYEDSAAWDQAMNAWAETLRHAARLAEDPAYRAADGMFSNVAHDPLLQAPHRVFRWVEPYAMVWMSREPLSGTEHERLGERALVLTQVYRFCLAHFGEELGWRDLMAPAGGGTLRPGVRSYPDGAPLLVLCRAGGPEEWEEEYRMFGRPRAGTERHGLLDRRSGALTLYSPTETSQDVPAIDALQVEAEMAAHQLLWWFSRQQNRWGQPGWRENALAYGTAAWIAGVHPEPSGRLRHSGLNTRLLGTMLAFASRFSEQGQPYPFLPLEDLLRLDGPARVATWSQTKLGVPAQVGWQLFRQQAWAFVAFLDQAEGGKRRAIFHRLLEALCRREMDFGQGLPVARKILDITTEEGWKDLDTEFQRWVRDDLWKRDVEEEAPESQAPAGDPHPTTFLAVHLGPDGARRLQWSYSPYGRDWISAKTTEDDSDATLRNLLRRLADLPAVRPTEGPARIEVVLNAPDSLGWHVVQEIAGTGIEAGVDPGAIRVANVSSALTFEGPDALPTEEALGVILRRDEAETVVMFADDVLGPRSTAQAEALPAMVKAHLEAVAQSGTRPTEARISFRPAAGTLPPIADVRAVIHALEAAGITNVFVASPARHSELEPDALGAYEIVVRLAHDGAIVIVEPDGNEIGPLPLASGTPEEQRKALLAIRTALTSVTERAPREVDGSSTARILVEGDRRARWQYVQWIMQIAADPKIQVYKIQFRVRGP